MFNTYDIRSSANACKTLVGLSGVDISTWEKFVGHESEYRCVLGACAENSIYEINEMLKENGITPLESDPDFQ